MARVAVGQASAQQGSFVMIRIAQQTKPPVPADCVDSHVIPWIRPAALVDNQLCWTANELDPAHAGGKGFCEEGDCLDDALVVLTNFVFESVL